MIDRGVTFELDKKAINWLADKGYDERMGARPLGRVIQEYIKKPLADELLFGKLKNGGTVKVTTGEKADGKIGLMLDVVKAKPVKPQKEQPEDELVVKPEKKTAKAEAVADTGTAEPKRKSASVPKVPRSKE